MSGSVSTKDRRECTDKSCPTKRCDGKVCDKECYDKACHNKDCKVNKCKDRACTQKTCTENECAKVCRDRSCHNKSCEVNKGAGNGCIKNVLVAVPSVIPQENIVLKKLDDGYSVTIKYDRSCEAEGTSTKSSFQYFSEEHYGRKVKSISGHKNEDGNYLVDVQFEEK